MNNVKRIFTGLLGFLYYGLPAGYRYVTKEAKLPLLSAIEPYKTYEILPGIITPPNIFEKLLVNPIFPGGVSSIILDEPLKKVINNKYLRRITGSLIGTSLWTSIQFVGYTISDIIKYNWPHGENPFESPGVYPFNVLIALTLAPLVPYAVDYIKNKIKK